uniref:hypothetical protein n=1 Tax=Agaricus bitorquis TaxID=5343 RepID=UPI00279B8DD5|nr:hypothetical protein QLP03_mgp006 [Agaricus bitorquis]WFG54062.1 hypothetical protein [Agaricus bitorquis]
MISGLGPTYFKVCSFTNLCGNIPFVTLQLNVFSILSNEVGTIFILSFNLTFIFLSLSVILMESISFSFHFALISYPNFTKDFNINIESNLPRLCAYKVYPFLFFSYPCKYNRINQGIIYLLYHHHFCFLNLY